MPANVGFAIPLSISTIGHPVMDPLVFFVADDPRSAHRFLLCWE